MRIWLQVCSSTLIMLVWKSTNCWSSVFHLNEICCFFTLKKVTQNLDKDNIDDACMRRCQYLLRRNTGTQPFPTPASFVSYYFLSGQNPSWLPHTCFLQSLTKSCHMILSAYMSVTTYISATQASSWATTTATGETLRNNFHQVHLCFSFSRFATFLAAAVNFKQNF